MLDKMQRRRELDNQSKEQHEVMVTYASNVATQGCYRSCKNRVSAPTFKAPCTNLHRYKISHDNNYTSILGIKYRHNLPC